MLTPLSPEAIAAIPLEQRVEAAMQNIVLLEAELSPEGATSFRQMLVRNLDSVDWLDTPEAEDALGYMNFQTGPMAHLYQELGEGPPAKAESEQAFMLRKFLKYVRENGKEWRQAFGGELETLIARVKAKREAEKKTASSSSSSQE
jgi:hypothetical protein